MPLTEPKTPTPRWKAIYDQLRAEVPNYDYGSRFYTIADICEKFDVSAITARRVLTELQDDGLVEKIPRRGTVIRHVPRTLSIRMIVPSEAKPTYFTDGPVIMRSFAGITSEVQRREVNFASIPEARVVEMYESGDDGVGFIVPSKVRRATMEVLRHRKLPFVYLDVMNATRDASMATIDREAAGYMATKHLLALGHRRIAWVTGAVASGHFRQRLKGYRRALKEAGIAFRWRYIHESDATDKWQNDNAMNQFVDLRPRPTAILTGDDDRAIFVLKYCMEHGLAVPGDMSVMGYPNYAESALTSPALTVIDANYEKLGAAVVNLLIDRIAQGDAHKPKVVRIAPSLVERRSVGPAPRRARSRRRRRQG